MSRDREPIERFSQGQGGSERGSLRLWQKVLLIATAGTVGAAIGIAIAFSVGGPLTLLLAPSLGAVGGAAFAVNYINNSRS